MIILSYLLLGFVALLALTGWVLFAAMCSAEEGYEDALGFHVGGLGIASVAIEALAPAVASVTVASAAFTAASPLFKRHRRGHSASPFGGSVPPFPIVASASPFEISCAETRTRAQQVPSNPPFAEGLLGSKTSKSP